MALHYVWEIFWRLRGRKGGGLSGPEPFSWSELEALVRLTGWRLSPWEIRLVEMLDNLYLAADREHNAGDG